MQNKHNNLMFRYAVLAFIGGLAGAYIAHKLSYTDGSIQAYLMSAFAASIGGSIGGLIRQSRLKRKAQQSSDPKP